MPRSVTTPSFAMLVQRFFTEHLTHHRAMSPRTVAAYGDTFLSCCSSPSATRASPRPA